MNTNSTLISLQGFQEQMMQNLSQMTDVIDPLAAAAKSEPEKIGHRVCAGCILICVGVTSDPNETIRKDIIYVAVQYHRFVSICFWVMAMLIKVRTKRAFFTKDKTELQQI